ncbi:MAG: PQQ-binding-like beta-propeller repeat protein [Phycisphaerae bacterium]
MTEEDILFVGFNKRVAALNRETGEILWTWKATSGSGFVSLLLDGDRLFAAVSGYVYCLDPLTGQPLWTNPMKGFGTGTTSLASISGHSDYTILGEAAAQAAAAASAGAS